MRDYTGHKYNKLTLLHPIGPGGGTKGHLWTAACECGNTRQVHARDVAAGRIKSCGKCSKGLTPPRGGYRARNAEEARLRRLLNRTAKEALRKGVPFALSLNDIQALNLDKCSLCASYLQIGTLRLEIVDHVEGYTVSNTKALCPICKRHMAGDNLVKYLAYLVKVSITLPILQENT